jgi:peptidoglycan/xylan/chitin deacetylase (PgdA/CDA1 family)
MTRFHVILVLSALLTAAALLAGHPAWLISIAAVLAVVTGLGVTFPQLSLFGPFICRGSAAKKRVALTFDDGPDAQSTPALLDWLREEKIPVAFFAVGARVAANPELAARIVREGHLLENHSYAHSYVTNFFGVARLREEMRRTQNAVQKATGRAPELFRPPMGLSNPRTFRAAKLEGLRVIGWSARGLDTQCHDPEVVARRILRRVRSGGIILLHDGNIPAARVLATVKLLLAGLRARGYEVVRVDELLK